MGVMRPHSSTHSHSGSFTLARIFAAMLVFLAAFSFVTDAFAAPTGTGDLQAYAKEVGTHTNFFVDTLNYISFIMGVVLTGLGISDMRKATENAQQHPWKNAIIKVFVGGIFMSLPYIADIATGTMEGFTPIDFTARNAYKFASSATVTDGSLSGIVAKALNNAGILVSVANYIAFIIATFFTIRGIQMIRAHIENPANAPLPDAIKRLAVGGALFSFPDIVNIVFQTFGSFSGGLANTGFAATGGGATDGLDGMMVHFIGDISNVAYFGIEVFCYIAGVLLILFAMQRLVRTAQDGPRGPLGFGTIMMFIVAGLLLSFPQFLTALDKSTLGLGQAKTQVQFMSSISGAGDTTQAKNVFSAVLAFMAVIGFLSVVRGLFILKAFADGNQQSTMMSVVTHIVAGALCINLGAFVNAVQKSLGLTDIPVTFN